MPSVVSSADPVAARLQKPNQRRTPLPVLPTMQGIKPTTGAPEVVRQMPSLLQNAWMKMEEICKFAAGISINSWAHLSWDKFKLEDD